MHPMPIPPSGNDPMISNPLIPAFLIGDGREMGFRCPCCGRVHTHGYVPSHLVHWRGGHCLKPAPGWGGYRLIIAGRVTSIHRLPKLSFADVRAFNLAIIDLQKEGPSGNNLCEDFAGVA